MLTADEIINLKAKVLAELTRRVHNGSLIQYTGPDYEFSTTPTKNKPVYAEQGEKFIKQLLQINDVGNLYFNDMARQQPIPSSFNYNEINAAISKWESDTTEQSGTSCRGGCSGLCYGACSSG